MITSYPVPFHPSDPAGVPGRSAPLTSARTPGSWRYDASGRSRSILGFAVAISLGLHLGVLFGIRPGKEAPKVVAQEKTTLLLLSMPKLEELEEPEVFEGEARENTDTSTLVPMQADLPQLSRPSEFVQQINFTSLLEKPDLSNININVIPESFRGGRKLAENIGKIFNLADLDRIPDPVLQQAPLYPIMLKRDGVSGRVKVEFIVDTEGKVLNAAAVEATHEGFVDAAVIAVSKWKFRPGIKAGRKVNTRMAVPIVFSIEDAL